MYIWFFVPEKNKQHQNADGEDEDEEELQIFPSQIFSIMKDVLGKPHVFKYLAFLWLTQAACAIDYYISDVYLTNDLKFSR